MLWFFSEHIFLYKGNIKKIYNGSAHVFVGYHGKGSLCPSSKIIHVSTTVEAGHTEDLFSHL